MSTGRSKVANTKTNVVEVYIEGTTDSSGLYDMTPDMNNNQIPIYVRGTAGGKVAMLFNGASTKYAPYLQLQDLSTKQPAPNQSFQLHVYTIIAQDGWF